MAVIDLHAHVLPGADHGSSSVETSLLQLSYAAHVGVGGIVATPHFYPHLHEIADFTARRASSFAALYAAVADVASPLPAVRLGAEVLLCRDIEHLHGLSALCFQGTRTLMLELPFNEFSLDFCDTIESLRSLGYKIILAHADRYAEKNIEETIAAGALLQLNAGAFMGFLRRKRLFDWVDRELVVALGSDIHGENASAYRDFSRACRMLGAAWQHIEERSDAIFSAMSDPAAERVPS